MTHRSVGPNSTEYSAIRLSESPEARLSMSGLPDESTVTKAPQSVKTTLAQALHFVYRMVEA